MIYAGRDSNGQNFNKNAWQIPGGGAGLIKQADGSVRSASLRGGQIILGASNSYSRPVTKATFEIPYKVTVDLKLHKRLDAVTIFGENRTPTWTWGVNVHPVFVNEDNNIVTGFAPNGTNRWSASGQDQKKYGIARDELFVATWFDHNAQFGGWHTVDMVVPEAGVHEVWWDGQMVYRVRERPPFASWWASCQGFRASLRLDFYDYSLKGKGI